MSPTRRLAELRAPELAELLHRDSILVQPLGAVEQHGPHLPYHTDLLIAVELAAGAVVGPVAGGGLHYLSNRGQEARIKAALDLLDKLQRALPPAGMSFQQPQSTGGPVSPLFSSTPGAPPPARTRSSARNPYAAVLRRQTR